MGRAASQPSRVLAVHLVVVAAVLSAACSAGHVKAGPVPTFMVTSTTSTSLLDYSAVNLGPVAGRKVVQVAIGPGMATLNGTVSGPDGPAAGATVHVERIVDTSLGSTDVPAQADGTWTLPAVLGGLYRVRAYRAPDLALVQPVVVFLAATDTRTVDVHMGKYGSTQINAAIAPDPPILGQAVQLAVRVTADAVDSQGVVRAQAKVAVPVLLSGDGRWAVEGLLTKTTNPSGVVKWQMTCQALGSQQLSVAVDGADVFPLNLPPCAPVPTTTTSTTTLTRGPTTTAA